MKKIIIFAAPYLISGLVFIACKKEQFNPATPINNYRNDPPAADAGVDQTIYFPVDSVVLIGSGTDVDGYIFSYNWSYVSGPIAFTLVNADNSRAKVKNMATGIYEFELKVTDNKGLFATDRTVVLVLDTLQDPNKSPWDY